MTAIYLTQTLINLTSVKISINQI